MPKSTPLVSIIMGSDSDLHVMRDAVEMLKRFDVLHEVRVISAHRTPQLMFDYATEARDRGIRVIIAGAGGAAHLPGMVASITTLPVIGVPVALQHFGGADSLYSIVQMPTGIPVATVAVNGAANAALLAIRILAVANADLDERMTKYQAELRQLVDEKDEKVREEFPRSDLI